MPNLYGYLAPGYSDLVCELRQAMNLSQKQFTHPVATPSPTVTSPTASNRGTQYGISSYLLEE